MIRYVIPGHLARSSRPGYTPDGRPVPKTLVDAWLADVKAHGIASIICLLHDEHLKLYTDLGTELPSYYRRGRRRYAMCSELRTRVGSNIRRLVEERECDEARVTLEYYPGSDAPAYGQALVDGRRTASSSAMGSRTRHRARPREDRVGHMAAGPQSPLR